VENSASGKGLERAPTDDRALRSGTGGPVVDILPNTRFRFSSRFAWTGADRPVNPYLGIVVALEGLSAQTLAADLNERVRRGDGALLPNLVACVGNGYLVTRYNQREGDDFNVGKATLGGAYDGFRAFKVEDLVLSSLHLGMNVLLSGIRLRNRDLTPDWLDELRRVDRKSQIESLFALWEEVGGPPAETAWDDMESDALAQGDHDFASKLKDLRQRGRVRAP